MMTYLAIARSSIAVLILSAGSAMAVPIQVVLNGLSFQDGGTIVNGSSFTLDTVAQTVTNVDITTTTGTLSLGSAFPNGHYPGRHYSVFTPVFSCFSCVGQIPGGTATDIVVAFLAPPLSLDDDLQLQFRHTASGLTVIYGDNHSVEDYGAGGHRYLMTSAVPETATQTLLALGMIAFHLLGLSRRRAARLLPAVA